MQSTQPSLPGLFFSSVASISEKDFNEWWINKSSAAERNKFVSMVNRYESTSTTSISIYDIFPSIHETATANGSISDSNATEHVEDSSEELKNRQRQHWEKIRNQQQNKRQKKQRQHRHLQTIGVELEDILNKYEY